MDITFFSIYFKGFPLAHLQKVTAEPYKPALHLEVLLHSYLSFFHSWPLLAQLPELVAHFKQQPWEGRKCRIMYQDSNLHGQMSKKLGLPQNHVKRNNIKWANSTAGMPLSVSFRRHQCQPAGAVVISQALPGSPTFFLSLLFQDFYFFPIIWQYFTGVRDAVLPPWQGSRGVEESAGGGRAQGGLSKIRKCPLSAGGCRGDTPIG